jgi:hypothetical protein
MILALWLLSLPFRLLAALGLRRSVILACLFILTVTAYGVAEDLGLLEPPARAAPVRKKPAAGQPTPSRAAIVDIPAGYLRLYRLAGARYRVPWSVLAAVGRSSPTTAAPHCPEPARAATGPGPVGPCSSVVCRGARPATPGSATAAAASMTRPMPSRPRPATWSTTAPAATSTGPCSPTTAPGRMSPRSSNWPAATPPAGVGGGEWPDRPPPRQGAGLDQAADRGLLWGLRHRAGPPPQPEPGPPSRPAPALPGLRHPDRPAATRYHQPGHRPRPYPRPRRPARPAATSTSWTPLPCATSDPTLSRSPHSSPSGSFP